MMGSWRNVICFVIMGGWFVPLLCGQSSFSPVINPVGLEDQRLNLLASEGYQLIEQANQALESGLRLRAEDRINQLLYQHNDALVPLPVNKGNKDLLFRNFVSVPEFVKAWYFRLPPPESLTQREKNKQSAVIKGGIIPSLEYARAFPHYISGNQWYLALCDELISRGELEAARIVLSQYATLPVIGVNKTYTGKWQPNAELVKSDQAMVEVRKIVLEILEGRESSAIKAIESIASQDSQELQSLGGLRGNLHSLLFGFLQQHFGGEKSAVEFQPQNLTHQTGSRVFESGQVWQLDLSKLLMGQGVDQRLDVRFKVVGDQLFANTLNGILALDLNHGRPLFGEGNDAYWLIRHNGNEVASWFDPEIPYWGNSTPVVEVVGDLLAARQGDPALTHHQSVEAAEIRGNSVVVLDLAEQGRMLDGFPITLPAAQADSYRVFATAPKIVGEQLLVGIRENQAFQCRHYLASYDLAGGTLNWKCYVGSARPIANRTITDLVSCGLEIVGPQAIFTTNTGMVASIDLSGQLNWVCSYPRSYHAIASAELESRSVRRSTAGFDRDAMSVIIAPADTELVFSLDLRSGLPLGCFDDAGMASAEIAVTSCGHLLLCGNRIWQMEFDETFKPMATALMESAAEISGAICIDGDRVYRVNDSRELCAVSWDKNTGEALLHTALSDMPNTVQIQMNHRLAIIFDGKMIKAVKAVPVVKVNEK
ncbi:MAG: hypothetical protein CMJ76_00695 [Planctomycetaceae bacterium]|nr:hypothetical protein [Planctomycetaceae bacterium]